MTLRNDPLLKGLARSRQEISRFSSIQVASRRSSTTMNTGLLELARGVEDFAISATLASSAAQGIAMGMRGAANNISTFAARFGAIGAIISIGVTALTVATSWFARAGKAAKDAEPDLKGFNDQMQRSVDMARENAQFQNFMRRNPDRDSVHGRRNDLGDRRREIDEEMKVWGDKRKQAHEEVWRNSLRLKSPEQEKEQKQILAEQKEAHEQLVRLATERQRIEQKIHQLNMRDRDIQVGVQRENRELRAQEEALGLRGQNTNEDKFADRRKAIEDERQRQQEQQERTFEKINTDAQRAMDILTKAGMKIAPGGFGEFKRTQDLAAQRDEIAGLMIPQEWKNQLLSMVTEASLLEKSPKLGERPGAAALSMGSSEAISAVLKAQRGSDPKTKLEEKQLATAEKMYKEMKKVAENTSEAQIRIAEITP